MEAKADLVIQNLTNQIGKLSRENAINYALAMESQEHNAELERELEQYRKKESAE